MTGEPMHTTSKERMAPELMASSEHAPQLSQTASKVQWLLRFDFSYVQPITQRHRQKNSKISPRKYDNSCASTIDYCLVSAAAILHFAFSYVQPITQHYKQRTVLESSLQSVQSPWKIWMIPVYKCTVGKPCIVPLRIDTFGCKQKEMGHKAGPPREIKGPRARDAAIMPA